MDRLAKERFGLLDGMRGIAAAAVGAGHATMLLPRYHPASTGLAVDFFFCLSGFVVAHAYGERLQGGALGFWPFMRKRLIRLYPMLAFGLMLGFLAHLYVEGDAPWIELGRGLLLLPHANAGTAFVLDVPMWSLLFEIAASAGLALILRRAPRSIPWLLAASGLLLAPCILIAGHITTFGVAGVAGLLKGGLRIAYPFLLGVVLHRYRVRLPRLPSILAPALLVVALSFSPAWTGPYQAICAMLVLPAVVAAGVNGRVSPRLGFLERLSYPFYLVHFPVILAAGHAMHGFDPALTMVVALAASTALAYAAVLLYDEPARQWLTQRFDRRRVTATQAAIAA